MYGSNYPGGGGQYPPYGGQGYPPYGGPPQSSGPPPPPQPGAYGGYAGYSQGSAYNVNAYPQYGGGYGGYAPQPYQQPGGYNPYAGGYNPYGGHPGAVPGFTVPAGPGYGGQGAPPPQQPPPPSMHYNMAQNHMTAAAHQQMQWRNLQKMGIVDNDDYEAMEKARQQKARRRMGEDEEEEGDKQAELEEARERARKLEERTADLMKKLEDNSGMKEELRSRFLQELMRRQEVSGTFEETTGTVFTFGEYDNDDPCAKWFEEEKGSPIYGEGWDPLYDAEYLRKGIRGWGTDEAAIISLVSTRSNYQRSEIMKAYKTSYGRDLIKDLKGDLSGNFEEAILALFETPARYDAWSIKHAIYGLGTDEATLIEILMTRTNAQIQEMVHEYNKIAYKKKRPVNPEDNIEKDIEDDCGGDFKRLLISAVQGNRRLISEEKLAECIEEQMMGDKWSGMFVVNYPKLCNETKCQRLAQELFNAGEEKWGTDEETFNRIFSCHDFYTLRTVYDEYVKLSQRDIINSVERETSGDYKKGLKAIVQCVKCRPMYFAERLYKAMKGLGTKDSVLIRIIIARAEIDLVQIKQCFLDKYGQTLWNFIKHDTSGDYRKLLLAIAGTG